MCKLLMLVAVLVTVATGQLLPQGPFGYLPDQQYAASLGGAPVGLYDKKTGLGWGPFGGLGSEVTGVSLGGAPVGVYGRDNQPGGPGPFPLPLPLQVPSLPFPLQLPSLPLPLQVPSAPFLPVSPGILPFRRPGRRVVV